MERFILFPKNEIHFFNEGKKSFNDTNYNKAITFFEKAIFLKYLKSDCIKYLIDCHIELHNYDEVYKMIEDEFVDQNVDEEYLLKKYLYTMVLDEQYIEANEIINIYKKNKVISKELSKYLDSLLEIIDKKLLDRNSQNQDQFFAYFSSDQFEDHIQIILNLEQLDYVKYETQIHSFLNNQSIDSFVKYNLLKYLFDNQMIESIDYTNFYYQQYKITSETFIDILLTDYFNQTIEIVTNRIENDYSFATQFIKNIWLDYCINHYPNLIKDKDIASCILHILVLKSINVNFNLNDLCKSYNINSRNLFEYFDC